MVAHRPSQMVHHHHASSAGPPLSSCAMSVQGSARSPAKGQDDGHPIGGGLTFVARLRARPQVLTIKRARAARAENAVRESTRRTSKWKGLGAFFLRTGSQRMSICLGQDLQAKRSADEAQHNANGAVLMVEEGQEKSVPFWQQGDLDMYTEANLAKRYKLRHSPEVLEVLQLWWACAQRSMQSEKLQVTALARDDYVRLCTKIYKAMIESFDEAEAAECSEEDWLQDSQGEAELSRERFLDAMFELADVWTRTIEPAEYAAFMRDLFGHVAHSKDGVDYFWKADADIVYGGYVLEEEEEEEEGEEEEEQVKEAPPKTKRAPPLEPAPPPKSPPPKPPPSKPKDAPPFPTKYERPALPPVEPPKKAARPPPQPTVPRKPAQQKREHVDWGAEPEAARRPQQGGVWLPGGFTDAFSSAQAMDPEEREEAARKEWVYKELERKKPLQGGLPALVPLSELGRDQTQSSTWQQLRGRLLQRPEAARGQWDGLKEGILAASMAASASSPALLESREPQPAPPPVTDASLAPAPAPESVFVPVPVPAAAPRPAIAELSRLPPPPPAAKAGAARDHELNVPRAAPWVHRAPRVNAAVAYVGRSSPVNSAGGSVPRKAPCSDAMAAFGDFSAMRVR